jgi:ABC-2 type transport system permease protein
VIGVVRSEWTKLRSLRSTALTVVIAFALAIGFGVLITRGLAHQWVDGTAEDRAGWDPVYAGMLGCFTLAQLAVAALGVVGVTAEYTTGAIRTSLAAVPRRSHFLAAKVAVVALSSFVVSELMVVVAYLFGQPTIADVGAPRSTLDDDGVLGVLLGGALWLTAIALLGLALGILFRATAAAFAVVVGATLIAPLVSGVLPAWFAKWWPTMAGTQIFHTVHDPGALTGWQGLAVLWTTVAALLLAAYAVFRRRDA